MPVAEQKTARRVDIVGSGPAGLAVAIGLLGRGAPDPPRVTIWTRDPSPRTTPCGEGILPERLGLVPGFDSDPYVAQRLVGIAVDVPGARRMLVDVPSLTLRRDDWIAAMAARAETLGATLRFGQALTMGDVRALDGDVVVGCDGPSSRVARIVGSKSKAGPAIQIRLPRPATGLDRLVFRWDPAVSEGYAWVFPRGDVTLVGALAPATSQNFGRMATLARTYGLDPSGALRESWPIPFGGSRVRQGRYALVGDAAGVANPLTKGGIGPSLIQADVLCRALLDGGLDAYEAAMRGHPLYDETSQRAQRALTGMRLGDMRRLIGSGPGTVLLDARAVMTMSARALWLGLARPGFIRDVGRVRAGLRHGLDWGW